MIDGLCESDRRGVVPKDERTRITIYKFQVLHLCIMHAMQVRSKRTGVPTEAKYDAGGNPTRTSGSINYMTITG